MFFLEENDMRLGVKGRYAVTAMIDLCEQPEGAPASLADIAKRQGLPVPYLEQLFVKLRKAGLVESIRGPHGGYLLARERAQICVDHIVIAVEEGLTFTACSTRKGCQKPSVRCRSHDLWAGLDAHVHTYLSSVTLDDLHKGVLHHPSSKEACL